MIYLVETEMLGKLGDKKLASLTAKDKLILVSFEGDQLPVSAFSLFQTMKAKLEVKTLPRTGDPAKDQIVLAYTFGRIAEQMKKDSMIRIFSKSFEFMVERSDVAAALGILLGDEIKKRSYTRKKEAAKEATEDKEEENKKTLEPAKTSNKAPVTPTTASKGVDNKKNAETAKAPIKAPEAVKKEAEGKTPAKRKRLPESLSKFLIKEAGTEVKELVEAHDVEIRTALAEATDPKIGLKTKLELLLLGEKGWDKIWKVLSENFYEARIKYLGKTI